jgi:hypothetical protein
MAARHFVCGDAKALARDPLLELSWDESVIARNENAGRHCRPGLEGATRSQDRIRLARFALRQSLVDHRLWHIVEKVRERIKRCVGLAPVVQVLPALRLTMACIPPPVATRNSVRAGAAFDRDLQACHESRKETPSRPLTTIQTSSWVPDAGQCRVR